MGAEPSGSSTVLAWAAAAQAFFALVLAAITYWYANQTRNLAKTAEQQVTLAQEQLRLSVTPNLMFKLAAERGLGWDWAIVNLGPYSVHIQAILVQKLGADDVEVARGLLKSDGFILRDWSSVLGANQEVRVRNVGTGGVTLLASAPLSGPVRLTFYFVYGPTGAQTHALDVKLRIGATVEETQVFTQLLRLNEAIPQEPATRINQIQAIPRGPGERH